QTRATQDSSNARNAWVARRVERGTVNIAQVGRLLNHGPKLVKRERPCSAPETFLVKENGAATFESNNNCDQNEQRTEQNQRNYRESKIDRTFDSLLPDCHAAPSSP